MLSGDKVVVGNEVRIRRCTGEGVDSGRCGSSRNIDRYKERRWDDEDGMAAALMLLLRCGCEGTRGSSVTSISQPSSGLGASKPPTSLLPYRTHIVIL